MAAKNSYVDMAELIADYIAQDVDDYLGQSISVNSVTLSCDVYRVEDGTSLTNAIFTGCTENDDHTQIVVGRNLSVASGVTLTPPYRCKGLFIGSPGQFNNNGTISMTSRGASAAGQNIKLVNSYSISATGGSAGSTASGLSCAGGGNGARVGGGGSAGSGGTGTSYSGGAGGAGNGNQIGNMAAGSSSGGAGGSGSFNGSYTGASCGGAGNPGGTSASNGGTKTNGSNGTGGLLVIFADILNQNGSLTSQGSSGGGVTSDSGWWAGGGGSGGGCVVLLSKIPNIIGTYNVNGGAGGTATKTSGSGAAANGGAGGTGKYASYTVTDMIIAAPTDLSLALTMEEYMDELDPVDGRLLGLMDNDELVYEFSGKRHRAMRTDADFTEFPVPPTSQFEDAVITNPQDGDVLVYDGTAGKWKNGSGHEYSTTEKVVGKWIDGRPIYEKVYDISSASVTTANTWTTIPNTKINDIYKVIKIEGFCRWLTATAGNYQSINVPSYQMAEHYLHACYQTNYGLMVVGNGFGLSNYAGAVSGSRECYLTILYTKTTDTASS